MVNAFQIGTPIPGNKVPGTVTVLHTRFNNKVPGTVTKLLKLLDCFSLRYENTREGKLLRCFLKPIFVVLLSLKCGSMSIDRSGRGAAEYDEA